MVWKRVLLVGSMESERQENVKRGLWTLVFMLSSIWFFSARDDRGRTARLTADAWYYHAYLPSLVFDQDLDFRDEYKTTKNWYRFGQTPIGRQANVFGIGPAVYEAPFFLVGHGIAKIASDRADGFSRPEVEFSLYASLLFSLGAIFFGARLVSRRLGGRYGPVAIALLVAMGGPVVYYAIRQPGYAHPFATFWIAWLVDYWDASFQPESESEPRSRRYWIGMGLLIGAASLARPQMVLWATLGGYAAFSDLRRMSVSGLDRKRVALQVSHWALGGAIAFLLVLPQLLAWKTLYGSYLASPQGEGFMWWAESAWVETLMSSRNGLFPWAPMYAIGFIGLLIGLRRHRRISSALLLGLFLQAYVNGAAWDWWGGGAFGGRRFDSCFIVFVFGLGVILSTIRGSVQKGSMSPIRKVALGVFALFCVSLGIANARFASTQSAPSVRIYGGQSASSILRKRSGIWGHGAAWVSSLSNLPARAVFALQNDVGLRAYDRLVGVHHLGELYPGLNSFRGKKLQRLDLNPQHPGVAGLQKKNGQVTSPSGKVALVFGLNRRGAVELRIRVRSAEAPTATLNGQGLELAQTSNGNFTATVTDYSRGSNRMEIHASPGFSLLLVELSAKVNAVGQDVPR